MEKVVDIVPAGQKSFSSDSYVVASYGDSGLDLILWGKDPGDPIVTKTIETDQDFAQLESGDMTALVMPHLAGFRVRLFRGEEQVGTAVLKGLSGVEK